jgi:tripartite-type tricarboxylate transporter receptor subunit TctC
MRVTSAIAAGLSAAAIAWQPAPAEAQFYRGKTVTMIINYPAGGPTDIEGRIVAQHLPKHIPGSPRIIVRNIGGAGGMIGSNHVGEISRPDGETIGFFTWNPIAQLLQNPGLRVNYSDFRLLAGVENPVITYIRRDTPPGIKVATDIMKANEFQALSLDAHNTNTIQQSITLDLLGVKYRPVVGYRGLRDVETAILQNEGQLANSSLPGWRASIQPTMEKQGIVIPLWQLAPPRNGKYVRSAVVPELPTFEEFYAQVKGGKQPSGLSYDAMRTVVDAQTSMFRTAFMPPKSPDEAVKILRAAFVSLWKDKDFIADYSKVVRSEPVLVTGDEGEEFMSRLGSVKTEIRDFIKNYGDQLLTKKK